MSTTPAGAATTAPLTLRTGCEVHHPGDPGYDRVRMPWNLAVDQRPDVVALPRTVEEVVDVVRAAAAAGLRVAPQATGHGAGPLGEQGLTGAVLLRTSALTGVTVDPVSRTARVLGGTTWDAVLEAAAPHGLTAAHGSAPDVGVIGYLLGGGLSFYGRRHGLGVNAVRALDVVLPDGTLRRVDADDAELFWA
ncbi:MAG: FAD-dependent oxidoreductase, partial [Micrococcales bacterium]|nr:FAD-dependent oxidoreductase [Micrococcales bacterium]